MPRDLIPAREGPKEEISTPLVAEKRVFGDNPQAERNRADAHKARGASADLHARDFEKAKDTLGRMTIAQTLDFLTSMPSGVLEMYLLAEEVGENRPIILRNFPKPGARARERYLPKKRTRSKRPAAVDA